MAPYFIWDKNQTLHSGLAYLSELSLSWKLRRLVLFLKHAKFINTPQLLHLISPPGTLFHRLSQGHFLFALQVSAQISSNQESISLSLIQSCSHFSATPLFHIILFNCLNRVYHCDESFLFIFAKGKSFSFTLWM